MNYEYQNEISNLLFMYNLSTHFLLQMTGLS